MNGRVLSAMVFRRSVVIIFASLLSVSALYMAGCGKVMRMVSPGAEHYRQKWEASGINSYRMVAVIQKPGHHTPMGTYEIIVRDGRFESANGASSSSGEKIKLEGKPLPEEWINTIRLYSYATVSSIFGHIEKAEKESNSIFEVDYHPTLGYPIYFHVDPSSSVMDDELLIKVLDLEPLK